MGSAQDTPPPGHGVTGGRQGMASERGRVGAGRGIVRGRRRPAGPGQVVRQTQGNPLAAGLIAFGVGWLVSSLLPASEKEKQLAQQAESAVREHKDALLEPAKQAAQEMGEQLKPAAQEAVESVKSTAQDAAATVKDEGQSAVQDVQGQAQQSKDDRAEPDPAPDPPGPATRVRPLPRRDPGGARCVRGHPAGAGPLQRSRPLLLPVDASTLAPRVLVADDEDDIRASCALARAQGRLHRRRPRSPTAPPR